MNNLNTDQRTRVVLRAMLHALGWWAAGIALVGVELWFCLAWLRANENPPILYVVAAIAIMSVSLGLPAVVWAYCFKGPQRLERNAVAMAAKEMAHGARAGRA